MPNFDVFVSYNRTDASHLEFIVETLRAARIRVWRDLDQLVAGEDFVRRIQDAMPECAKVMICLGSELGVWQEKEVNTAMALGLGVIPVLLPGNETIPPFLRSLVWVDFRDGLTSESEWDRLLAGLRGVQRESGEAKASNILPVENRRAVEHHSVVVGIMREDSILLLRRAPRVKVGPGLWQLPGGKVNAHENAFVAAQRELKEETDLDINVHDLVNVTDLAEPWLGHEPSGGLVRLSVFAAQTSEKSVSTSHEHDRSRWVKLGSELPYDDLPLFGATARALRILRRYRWLHTPLSRLANILESSEEATCAIDATQIGGDPLSVEPILAMLGLLGLLEDRGPYRSSSTMSGALLRTLAAWSLTDQQIFLDPSMGQHSLPQNSDPRLLTRYRETAFSQHESLLAMFSYRLPNAVGQRQVADVLVCWRDEQGRSNLLLRWDFVARKFQIPAKGLEEAQANSARDDSAPARYVFARRVNEQLSSQVRFRHLADLTTAHTGAGSLRDGPLLRRYHVSVFVAEVPTDRGQAVMASIASHNKATRSFFARHPEATREQQSDRMFYAWLPIDELIRGAFQKNFPVQGFDELLDAIGPEPLESLPAFVADRVADIPQWPFDASCLPTGYSS